MAEPENLNKGQRVVGKGMMYDRSLIRIYDADTEDCIGAVIFRESMLLDFMWKNAPAKPFPESFEDEFLVNLLHYLPFDPDKLRELYGRGGACYVYRFVRDLDNGEKDGETFDIKVINSFQETFRKLMFGDSLSNEKIQLAILELLYNHWQSNAKTNLPAKLIYNVLPLQENRVQANLQFLHEEDCIYILTDTSGNEVSIKIKTKGIRVIEGNVRKEVEAKVDNRKYYTSIGNIITHGTNSPVNVNIGEINQAFDREIKKVEKSSLSDMEKEEAKKALNELQAEITGRKDENKIISLLKKLGSFGINITNWLMQNETIAPFLTFYLAKALQIPLG